MRYDAMTSNRVYREPMSDAEAQLEIERCARHAVRPNVVHAFLAAVGAPKTAASAGPSSNPPARGTDQSRLASPTTHDAGEAARLDSSAALARGARSSRCPAHCLPRGGRSRAWSHRSRRAPSPSRTPSASSPLRRSGRARRPLDGYAVGDRVQVQCRGGARHLVLARSAAPDRDGRTTGRTTQKPVTFGGTVTRTLRHFDQPAGRRRDAHLHARRRRRRPPTADAVGDHARVVCQNGTLEHRGVRPSTASRGDPSARTAASRNYRRSSDLGHRPHRRSGRQRARSATARRALGDFHVGDLVKIGCRVDCNLSSLLAPPHAGADRTKPPGRPRLRLRSRGDDCRRHDHRALERRP